ncbi:hypothetical protein TWF506_004719 [Arthrobotrys conoides]|uniref:F-box domain-containing protein n=1 Tax=Arthrobotrys conoides TaxID=74498 RepID=A0AAN8NJD5_9PEZI
MASLYMPWLSQVAKSLSSFGLTSSPTTSAYSQDKVSLAPEVSIEAETAINAVPYELWAMIHDYLPTRDLKALSSCSKAHRERAIPLLYAHIRLSESSALDFENGSSKDRRSFVREVTFQELLDGVSIHETIHLCNVYCAALGMFPNIIGIHIPFATTTDYEASIPRAIARQLTKYQFFKNLHKLCFDGRPISYDDPKYNKWNTTKARLNKQEKEFLNDGPIDISNNEVWNDIFPKSLEVASGFSLGHTLFTHHFKTHFVRHYHYPRTFYFDSASTLKSLTLTMQNGFGRHSPAVVFPQVRFLRMAIRHGIDSKMMSIMGEMCPAVQHLHLEGLYADTDRPERLKETIVYYISIRDFKSLRTARIPWPYKQDRDPNRCGKWATVAILCHSVKYWTGYMSSASHMTSLRQVDFAKAEEQDIEIIPSYPPAPGPGPVERGVTEVLRLMREDGDDTNWGKDTTFTPSNPEHWEPYTYYKCH